MEIIDKIFPMICGMVLIVFAIGVVLMFIVAPEVGGFLILASLAVATLAFGIGIILETMLG